MKAKDQALPGAKLSAVLAKVEAALFANVLFQSVARPKALTKLILSRYRTGKTYGLHVDNALMQGLRADLSFTLFLSDLASYEGGGRGDFVPITHAAPRGTRHKRHAVGRGGLGAKPAPRSRSARDSVRPGAVEACCAAEGKSIQFDRRSKTRSNLLRIWVET